MWERRIVKLVNYQYDMFQQLALVVVMVGGQGGGGGKKKKVHMCACDLVTLLSQSTNPAATTISIISPA